MRAQTAALNLAPRFGQQGGLFALSSRSMEASQPRRARRCAPSATFFHHAALAPANAHAGMYDSRPSAAKARDGRPCMDCPISRISPCAGVVHTRNHVEKRALPAPLANQACTSAALTSIETALLATSPPNRLVTALACNSTVPGAGNARCSKDTAWCNAAGALGRSKRAVKRCSVGHMPSAKRCSTKPSATQTPRPQNCHWCPAARAAGLAIFP